MKFNRKEKKKWTRSRCPALLKRLVQHERYNDVNWPRRLARATTSRCVTQLAVLKKVTLVCRPTMLTSGPLLLFKSFWLTIAEKRRRRNWIVGGARVTESKSSQIRSRYFIGLVQSRTNLRNLRKPIFKDSGPSRFYRPHRGRAKLRRKPKRPGRVFDDGTAERKRKKKPPTVRPTPISRFMRSTWTAFGRVDSMRRVL